MEILARHLSSFIPGVLFAEDFDDEPVPSPCPPEPHPDLAPEHTPPEDIPRYSATELQDAVAIAREEGILAGRRETLAGLEAKRAVSLEQAARSLAEARDAASSRLEAECRRIASTALTMLTSFLPCLADRFAADQLRSTLAEIMASLVDEGPISIDLHPDLVATAEQTLGPWSQSGTEISLVASAALGRSDLRARWRNGSATRDVNAIRTMMAAALSEAGLLDEDVLVANARGEK